LGTSVNQKCDIMKMGELRKLSFDELIDLAQKNDIFVWFDSTKPDVLDALKEKLVLGNEQIWCC
jgi:hypothetical protein